MMMFFYILLSPLLCWQLCDGNVLYSNIYYVDSGASNLQDLQQLLSSTLMIRREKSQVLTQLPPKQRQKILFELKDSNMKKVSKSFKNTGKVNACM